MQEPRTTKGWQAPVPKIRVQCRDGVTWALPACECCQLVPVYSSFLYFWLWMLGFPPAFRGKLCSVLSGILFWGTLVLSFNQENRCVVFFSWPYSFLSKYRWLNNCFKSWTMTSFVSRLRHFSTAVSCTMDLLGLFCFVFPFFSLCSSKLLVREKAGVGEENVSKVHQC